MKRQPSSRGVSRIRKSSYIHAEVARVMQDIADAEDKSFSYVVAEIVYAFFGLKVSHENVKRLSRRITRRRNVVPFRKVS